MQSNKIEQDIDEIYEYIESCKMQRLSTTKVIVPKDELYDFLDDLRRDVPEEINRYQKILRQKDKILSKAEDRAAEILADAQEQYKAMVEEQSILQEAYRQAEITVQQANEQAEQIIANAQAQAQEIGNGAIYYTKDLLTMAGKAISAAYESTINNSHALEVALQGHLNIIQQNMAELVPAPEQEAEEAAQYSEEAAATDAEA